MVHEADMSHRQQAAATQCLTWFEFCVAILKMFKFAGLGMETLVEHRLSETSMEAKSEGTRFGSTSVYPYAFLRFHWRAPRISRSVPAA
jgi:hypothetical protein